MSLVTVPQARRFTLNEYQEMVARGFFMGERVEFVAGEVLAMPPMSDRHASAVRLVDEALRKAFVGEYVFLVQMPIRSADSEPEPDFAVVQGTTRQVTTHPRQPLLLVEVAENSLAYDRTRKNSLYASCEIAEYWIVNLIEQTLEVRRRPTKDPLAEFGWSYGDLSILRRGDTIAPLALPPVNVQVADLLP